MRLLATFLFVFTLHFAQANSLVDELGNVDPAEIIQVENADVLWIYSFVEGQLVLKNTADHVLSSSIVQSGKIPVDISSLTSGSYTLHLINHKHKINRVLHFTKP